jgi:hypothetical protein
VGLGGFVGRAGVEEGGGKGAAGRAGSASSWVSAHCQIGIRNSFSFSNFL